MAKKKVSLEQIAEEMNDVMQYGRNEDGELVNEGDLIDTELSSKALKECIIQRAKEDLRPADIESFSPEVWDWFVDNDLVADDDAGEPDENEPENDDDNGSDDADGSDDDAGEDDEPEKSPSKPAGKNAAGKPTPNTPEKAQNGPSKASNGKKRPDNKANPESAKNGQTAPKKRQPPQGAMAQGGNEAYGVSLVEQGLDFDAFHEKYAELYKAAGKTDKDYIRKRARIYWGIAHKKLNRPLPDSDAPARGKKRPDNPEKAQAEEKPAAKKGKK